MKSIIFSLLSVTFLFLVKCDSRANAPEQKEICSLSQEEAVIQANNYVLAWSLGWGTIDTVYLDSAFAQYRVIYNSAVSDVSAMPAREIIVGCVDGITRPAAISDSGISLVREWKLPQ